MHSHDDMLTTAEAAGLLNVSVQRVNRLVEAGAVTRVARGLVDRASVDRYLAEGGGSRKRVWAEHTAWGAIALLGGGTPPSWVGQVQLSRLRKVLRDLDGPTSVGELVVRLRGRATVQTYSGHPSVGERLRADVVLVDRGRLGLVDDADVVDGYVTAPGTAVLVDTYRLREDPRGPITLRATAFDLGIVEHLVAGSRVVAAVDAATSLDPRERGAGERVLAEALEAFRR